MNDNLGILTRNPDWETKLILNRLRCARALRELVGREEKEQKDRAVDRDSEKQGKESPEAESAYINHRLEELRRWERSISGDQDRARDKRTER